MLLVFYNIKDGRSYKEYLWRVSFLPRSNVLMNFFRCVTCKNVFGSWRWWVRLEHHTACLTVPSPPPAIPAS